MAFTTADPSFTFPRDLESGQRVAVILTPAGSDTEFYEIGDDLTEEDILEKLPSGGMGRRLSAIVEVE